MTAFFIFENKKIRVNTETYTSLMNDDLDRIVGSRRKTDELLTEIYFNDIPLVYDRYAKCFYYSLPEDGQDAYDPVISWESNDIHIALESKLITDELIYRNESIRILIYDRYRYSICDLKCTTLPLIEIGIPFIEPGYVYTDSVISFLDNRERTYETYDGKIRIRGGITADLDKPGLRIELDSILKGDNNTDQKYYEIFGLERDNEFVLYTANVEKDHIRNVFTTNLWYDTCADDNSFGIKAGMSYRYCEVFINDEYWGLCALGNPISEKRGYVDTKKSSDKYPLENIYKLNFFGDRELIDYEKYKNDFFFAIKTNEDKEEAWQPFIDYIHILLNSDDKEELYSCVDLDNALDIYLYYDLVQAWDNAWFEDNLKFRNTYLVSKVTDDGSIRMIYIPWDMDRSWGHCREDGLEYPMDYTVNYPMVITPVENLLDMGDEEIEKLLYEKYVQLRSDKWSDENIFAMLDEYEKEAYGSGAFFRDAERWPQNYHTDNKDLSEFKEYVKLRLDYFDDYMNQTFGNDIMVEN